MAPTSRIALVTGANKGIGYAIVRHLALQYPASNLSKNGTLPFLIYLTARDQGRGETAVKELQADPQLVKAKVLVKDGGLSRIEYRSLDISQEGSIQEVGEFLKREHPDGIDVVINNAGIAGEGFDLDVVKKTLHSNYHGTMLVTNTLLPLLRDGGRVVQVASMAGNLTSKYSGSVRNQFLASKTEADITRLMDAFTSSVAAGTYKQDGWPSAAYSVSKSGVIGATRALAADVATKQPGRGILLNSCCPGWVVTDMTKGRGAKNVDQGAQTPVLLALGDIKGSNGEFWQDEVVKPW